MLNSEDKKASVLLKLDEFEKLLLKQTENETLLKFGKKIHGFKYTLQLLTAAHEVNKELIEDSLEWEYKHGLSRTPFSIHKNFIEYSTKEHFIKFSSRDCISERRIHLEFSYDVIDAKKYIWMSGILKGFQSRGRKLYSGWRWRPVAKIIKKEKT